MLKLKAYAKINIGLDILKKREDGYHEIKTVMQQISLYDELVFEKSDKTEIIVSGYDLPIDGDNLIYKAQSAIKKYTGKELDIKVSLEKKIPIAAGLAGGSTDAAAALKAINELYELSLSLDELKKIGKTVGADIPFCLVGGTMLSEGIGEKLTGVKNNLNGKILLINPGIPVSTKEVYQNIKSSDYGKIDVDSIVKSLENGELVTDERVNVMERYVFEKYPILAKIKNEMYNCGADIAFMSGSGSTVCGLFGQADIEYFKSVFPEYYIGEFLMI